jgi:hypothetical protein
MQVSRRKIQRKMYIRDNKSGQVFDSLRQASAVLGVSTQTLANYASGKVPKELREFDLDVTWVTLDGVIYK